MFSSQIKSFTKKSNLQFCLQILSQPSVRSLTRMSEGHKTVSVLTHFFFNFPVTRGELEYVQVQDTVGELFFCLRSYTCYKLYHVKQWITDQALHCFLDKN